MAETPRPEPGWWQASDGKWYPPEAATAPTPTVTPPPPTGRPVNFAFSSASELLSATSRSRAPLFAQIVVGVVGSLFFWAGIQLTFDLAGEYSDVTFGSLLLTSPLFSVGILGFGFVWYIRSASETNKLLVEVVDEMRKANAAKGAAQ